MPNRDLRYILTALLFFTFTVPATSQSLLDSVGQALGDAIGLGGDAEDTADEAGSEGEEGSSEEDFEEDDDDVDDDDD